MRDAFSYLASAIASLLLFFFLLRLLLQLVRADFRNPLAQGIVQLTNWLVLPLRKLLPPIGKLDSASFVAVVLIAAAGVGLQSLVRGGSLPDPALWVQLALLSTASNLLTLYFIAILLGVILSWVAPDGYSPAHALIYALTEPVLNPIRRVVPAVGGFDFSPLIALLAIGFVQRLLNV